MTRLIDANALKERVNRTIDYAVDEFDKGYNIGIQKAVYLIDNAPTVEYPFYAEAYQTGYEEGKNDRPKGEWINAEERLPDEMEQVLVWFEYYRYGDYNCMYQTYGFCYVCDGKWSPFINGETGWQDYNIIAWQPLPEPYGVDMRGANR